MKPSPPDDFTVRAYALEQAVKLYAARGVSPTNPTTRNSEIIEAAKVFESYLTPPGLDLGQHAEKSSPLAETIS